MLDKCVVTVDPDFDEVFELQEWGREAYIFKVCCSLTSDPDRSGIGNGSNVVVSDIPLTARVSCVE